MGKKKHQFINKKTAHKFNVVHRSQRDPLQPDEESSQHVLVPAGGMADVAGPSSAPDAQEEHVKYGIYYDDDYDYLQHLRPRGEGMLIMAERPSEENIPAQRDESFGTLNLPAEVLPSKYEEDIGMLNKGVLPRGPQPDWDPDIVAALDDGVDFDDPDNILDDDFISQANEAGSYDDDDDDDTIDDDFMKKVKSGVNMEQNFDGLNRVNTGEDDDEWETGSDVSSTGNFGSDDLSDMDDSEEETKSRFTNYSMTSSVIRRTEGLKLLDDHFERIMEEYDEEEIGAVDHEETTGTFDINNDLISQIVDEFIDQQKTVPLSETVDEDEAEIRGSDSDDKLDNDDEIFKEFEKKPSEKWDCESIISTYSNLYNHPKLIDEPKMVKLHKRTGVPLGIFNETKEKKEIETNDTEMVQPTILSNIRKKGETPDEKRNRKNEIKEQRKARRIEKKENKMVFKDEHRKQEQIARNKALQMGIKI